MSCNTIAWSIKMEKKTLCMPYEKFQTAVIADFFAVPIDGTFVVFVVVVQTTKLIWLVDFMTTNYLLEEY